MQIYITLYEYRPPEAAYCNDAKGSTLSPDRLVKLRLEVTWSDMVCLASSGKRIRMAETTDVWLYFTFVSQGLLRLVLLPINSSMEA